MRLIFPIDKRYSYGVNPRAAGRARLVLTRIPSSSGQTAPWIGPRKGGRSLEFAEAHVSAPS